MTKITKHAFEHNNRRYFRGNAHAIELLSYGRKRDPLGPDAFLEVEGRVNRDLLENKVQGLGTVTLDWNELIRVEGNANGKLNLFNALRGQRAIKGTFAEGQRGHYKLVGFAVLENQIERILNQEAHAARKRLADEGGDARIVSEIWVAMEAEQSQMFSATASYSVKANVAGVGLDLQVQGSAQRGSSITLSDESTFAYLLHKVDKWNKDKTKIEDLKPDYKG